MILKVPWMHTNNHVSITRYSRARSRGRYLNDICPLIPPVVDYRKNLPDPHSSVKCQLFPNDVGLLLLICLIVTVEILPMAAIVEILHSEEFGSQAKNSNTHQLILSSVRSTWQIVGILRLACMIGEVPGRLKPTAID